MAGLDQLNSLLTGSILSGDADKNAQKYLDQETGAYNGVTTPNLMPVNLQQEQYTGGVSPDTVSAGQDVTYDPVAAQQAAAALEGPSAYEGISDDPRLEADQQASLGALNQIANGGGMTAADRANLAGIEESANADNKSRQDAILQNEAERGMGGSGASLLARLSGSQAATQQENANDLNVAGQAQARALQAMIDSGNMAGSIRSQDFGEAAQKAAAADAVSRFNAQNATGVNEYNAGANNQMSQFNANNTLNTGMYNRNTDLGVAQYNVNNDLKAQQSNQAQLQGVANANTTIANNNTMYNANQMPQQNFNNQMGYAGGVSKAAESGVKYYDDQSQQQRQGFGNLMSGVGQAAGPVYNYFKTSPTSGNPQEATAANGYAGTDAAADQAGAASSATELGEAGAQYASRGGIVPGHARVPGDSPRNDTQLTHTSPGEVVLPRSVVNAKHPMAAIKAFLGNLHTVSSKPAADATDTGNYIAALSPSRLLHRDSQFQAGTAPAASGDANDIVAKIAALSRMGKVS